MSVDAGVNVGAMFLGIGMMTCAMAIAYWIYQFGRLYKDIADKEQNYNKLEIIGLRKLAEKKGIDLRMEIEKDNLFQQKKKNFKKRLEEEVFDEFFNKDKEVKTS